MVRAWAEIAQCPANGTTVSASAWCVNLPATNPDAVLKYAADRLVVCVTKTAERTVGDIEMAGLCEVLDTARSVAGQSYLAGLWRGAAHQAFAELTSSSSRRFLDQKMVKKLYENVTEAASDKYYDEFKTDMLPLLYTISTTDGHGDDSMLMEMRCLADRTATKPPESSTFKRLHTTFFQHYIDTIVDNKGKLTYGFPNTPFSTLIKEHVSVNGVLQEPSGHNLLRYTHNELAMYRLSELVGDRVKDANKVAHKVVPPKSSSNFWGKVESITHVHFKEMNWLVDSKTPETHPGLKVFLSWCNDGVQKAIADHRKLGKVVPFPHCLYLYALRNAFTHTADNKKGVRSAQLKRQIMMEGPPWNLNELLRKLEAQLVDKEKKSKKGKKSKKKGEKRKADADADAEQKKAKKMKKEKKAKKVRVPHMSHTPCLPHVPHVRVLSCHVTCPDGLRWSPQTCCVWMWPSVGCPALPPLLRTRTIDPLFHRPVSTCDPSHNPVNHLTGSSCRCSALAVPLNSRPPSLLGNVLGLSRAEAVCAGNAIRTFPHPANNGKLTPPHSSRCLCPSAPSPSAHSIGPTPGVLVALSFPRAKRHDGTDDNRRQNKRGVKS